MHLFTHAKIRAGVREKLMSESRFQVQPRTQPLIYFWRGAATLATHFPARFSGSGEFCNPLFLVLSGLNDSEFGMSVCTSYRHSQLVCFRLPILCSVLKIERLKNLKKSVSSSGFLAPVKFRGKWAKCLSVFHATPRVPDPTTDILLTGRRSAVEEIRVWVVV